MPIMPEHSAHHLMACHHCDLVHEVPTGPPGAVAVCLRCGCELVRHKPKNFQRPLALLCTAALLFVMFNAFPFLTFKKGSLVHQTYIISGIYLLAKQGMPFLAALVALNLLVIPGLHLLGSLYVLVPVSLNRRVPGMFAVFRYVRLMQPWHMVEIFMLGVLVSLVKLAKMAQILPGTAVYSLTGFIFVMAAAGASMDPHEVWSRWKEPS